MEGRQAKTDHNSQSKERKITQEAKENSKNKNMQTSWSVGKCYLNRAWGYFAATNALFERNGNLFPTFSSLFSGIWYFHFYESSSFTTPYTAQDYPLTVDLNEYVYLQYSVASSADLVIMAENCKATKDVSFYSWPQYTFLQNGLVYHCAVIKHRW